MKPAGCTLYPHLSTLSYGERLAPDMQDSAPEGVPWGARCLPDSSWSRCQDTGGASATSPSWGSARRTQLLPRPLLSPVRGNPEHPQLRLKEVRMLQRKRLQHRNGHNTEAAAA